MTGRVYLDWNASAPLRPEARAAMLAALEMAGNPSSVHAEGRAARAVVEKARRQLATALGAEDAEIVFTSGATEAAALALAGRGLVAGDVEHDAVTAWADPCLPVGSDGRVQVPEPAAATLQAANSETGVIQDLPAELAVTDATQAFGKTPFAFDRSGASMALVSAHKIGGPKGIGAVVAKRGLEIEAQLKGGGQEMGRRSGTENVAAIAGFGAAAEAAAADVAGGAWAETEKVRNLLEEVLEDGAKQIIFVGKTAPRLPNTSAFALPGWSSEAQVMAMDLDGFAVSAGSACSSGKVRVGRVPHAMGYDDATARATIRVSMGPRMEQDAVLRFAEAWLAHYRRIRDRAA